MKLLTKSLLIFIAVSSMVIFGFIACKKLDFGAVTKTKVETVTIVGARTIRIEINVFDLSGDIHPDYGLCYSATNPIPTISDQKVSRGFIDGVRREIINITNDFPGSRVYFRSYVMNGNVPQYSFEVKDIVTIPFPLVETLHAMEVSFTSSKIIGQVNPNNTNTSVSFEFGTTEAYGQTIDASPATIGGTNNIIVHAFLTDLQINTTYHYRVKASYDNEVIYGNDTSFTTKPAAVPTVTTSSVSEITPSSFVCGGNVLYDNYSDVTSRGICWSENENPTIFDYVTTGGSGTGSFSCTTQGLTTKTKYYVRAFASNMAGTAYGEQDSLLTLAVCPDSIIDSRDGKSYVVVTIGSQCWMGQNLNIGVSTQGINNQTDNGLIEKYCIDNSELNCNFYGGLYQWDEMMQYSINQGIQGICPEGWHIPTNAEWTILQSYLGGEYYAGGRMKQTGTGLWYPPNTGATNSSGFTALPCGYRDLNGSFSNFRFNFNCWTSSKNNTNLNYAYNVSLLYDTDRMYLSPGGQKILGYSVRCLKNE